MDKEMGIGGSKSRDVSGYVVFFGMGVGARA